MAASSRPRLSLCEKTLTRLGRSQFSGYSERRRRKRAASRVARKRWRSEGRSEKWEGGRSFSICNEEVCNLEKLARTGFRAVSRGYARQA
jgi:hypothetical protein